MSTDTEDGWGHRLYLYPSIIETIGFTLADLRVKDLDTRFSLPD